jgi:hypothetical protein
VTEDAAAQAWEQPVFVLHFVFHLTLPECSKNPVCSNGRWLAVFDRTEAGLTEAKEELEEEEMETMPAGPGASVSIYVAISDPAGADCLPRRRRARRRL